jgi:hypothetical protein
MTNAKALNVILEGAGANKTMDGIINFLKNLFGISTEVDNIGLASFQNGSGELFDRKPKPTKKKVGNRDVAVERNT